MTKETESSQGNDEDTDQEQQTTSSRSGWRDALLGALLTGNIFGIWYVVLLQEQNQAPSEFRLFTVLAIAFTSVILASAAASVIFKIANPERDTTEGAAVFRESMRRLAWLASPILGGYGLSQVVEQIVKAVV